MTECNWQYCSNAADETVSFPFGCAALCDHHVSMATDRWDGEL